MPAWDTCVRGCHFNRPEEVEAAQVLMRALAKMAGIVPIPNVGTRWSTRRFGNDTVVFAEWSLENEIASGFYDIKQGKRGV